MVGYLLEAASVTAGEKAHAAAVGMVVDLFAGGVQHRAAQQQNHGVGQVAHGAAD